MLFVRWAPGETSLNDPFEDFAWMGSERNGAEVFDDISLFSVFEKRDDECMLPSSWNYSLNK